MIIFKNWDQEDHKFMTFVARQAVDQTLELFDQRLTALEGKRDSVTTDTEAGMQTAEAKVLAVLEKAEKECSYLYNGDLEVLAKEIVAALNGK